MGTGFVNWHGEDKCPVFMMTEIEGGGEDSSRYLLDREGVEPTVKSSPSFSCANVPRGAGGRRHRQMPSKVPQSHRKAGVGGWGVVLA